MGSLQRITECVVEYVPDERKELAESALAAMSGLCYWANGGVAGPLGSQERIMAAAALIVGSAAKRAAVVTSIDRYVGDVVSPAAAYDVAPVIDGLHRSFPRNSVNEDIREALPWALDVALWQPLSARIREQRAGTAVAKATCRDLFDSCKEFTYSYTLAVIAGDQRAILELKPLIAAMPKWTLVGVLRMQGCPLFISIP